MATAEITPIMLTERFGVALRLEASSKPTHAQLDKQARFYKHPYLCDQLTSWIGANPELAESMVRAASKTLDSLKSQQKGKLGSTITLRDQYQQFLYQSASFQLGQLKKKSQAAFDVIMEAPGSDTKTLQTHLKWVQEAFSIPESAPTP